MELESLDGATGFAFKGIDVEDHPGWGSGIGAAGADLQIATVGLSNGETRVVPVSGETGDHYAAYNPPTGVGVGVGVGLDVD